MIQDIQPVVFDNAFDHPQVREGDILFYFEGRGRERRVAVRRDMTGGLCCPSAADAAAAGRPLQYLFSIDSVRCFLAMDASGCPDGFAMESPFVFRGLLPKPLCFAGMTACHLREWYAANRFCGRCAAPMKPGERERSLCCPACGNIVYPRISPAVIIGVTSGERILLSRYANREYKGRALLAGFCEIGETPEQTVAREAMEEVGVRVKNIRYYASQPWGFDGGLLLGFFADADGSTDITMDTGELAKAEWVSREDITPDDALVSLTATMIEAFRSGSV